MPASPIDPASLKAAMAQDGHRRRRRGDAGAAEERLDAAGRPRRPAQRASRPSPVRIAVAAAHLSGGDMVTAALSDADLRRRAWDAAVARGRSGNSGADHRRSRRAARGQRERRPCRGRDHADLFRLPGHEHDRARDRARAGARGLCQAENPHRAVAGLDHRLDERGRPPQAPGLRHRAAASRQARAARCSACRRWRARNAARTIPSCCPNSARPPARRCGAARPAANPSIISSVISMPHRHCERSEAIQHLRGESGLLRFARNDEGH